MTLPAPELHDQFILRRGTGAACPEGWRVRELAGWWLASHPNLPVIDLLGPQDRPVGFLLGWAVDPQGRLQSSHASPAEGQSLTPQGLEGWLYGHGGRFACVLLDEAPRLYLDPCGSLAVVFSRREPLAASTTTALRFDDFPAYSRRMLDQPVLQPNQFYPAGLTADEEIARLLPNHYLDLQTWQPVRHWPAVLPQRAGDDDRPAIDVLIDTIIDRVRRTILGTTAEHLAYLPLTAGRDSRMVVACARPAIDRVRFVTFAYEDEDRKPDLHVARRIARRFGLEHHPIPLSDPPESQRAAYLVRTGFAGHWGKARDFDLACRRHLDMARAWITGFGGEVGRAFYWKDEDDLLVPPSPQKLIERLNLPRDERTLAAWRIWQETAPHRDTCELLDLAYLEQRMGCWAGPHMYGAAPFRANLTPFCHREVLEAMMSLPAAFRRGQKMADALIARAWPELGELPYQQFTGVRRVMAQVEHRARQDAGAAMRRARRLLKRALGGRW